MEQELIKPIIRVGNSAGVLLPISWMNGKAKIKLVETPINIEKDILEILSPHLSEIKGIYLTGSYARNEQTSDSDVDILVITEKTSKRIENGKYSIILINENSLKEQLNDNILPLLPMIKECKPIINSKLIEQYKNTHLTRKNLRFHIETTKSAMKMNKEAIKLDKELSSNKVHDSSVYSLVLRLRGTYIVDCLINNKIPTTKGLLYLIKKITGSLESYYSYKRVKSNKKDKDILNIKEAEHLHDYILNKIKKQEKWLKERDK